VGQRLELKLAESNALTGALKFEVPDAEGGNIEPRGNRPKARAKPGQKKDRKGKHAVGKRGRPGNIRHQGRKK
jgi:ribonuclease R